VLQDSYVEIRNLTFSRGEHQIFSDVSFNIPRGKITVIMGPSGTGKTTLLNLIGGQLKPDQGSIHVKGIEVNRLRRKELLAMRREMSLMFQSDALFTSLNVYENVAFPLRVHTQFTEDMIHDLVLMKLEAVGLRGARDLMPSELSGGMARRVALACAVALDPKLMMYDEAFTGQDPISEGILAKLIRNLNTDLGMTSIIVTHSVTSLAEVADYIYLFAEGKIIGQGTHQEMINSDSPYVKQFMHGEPDGPVPFQYPAISYLDDLQTTEGA
jgi:phospholipid/cholesterol/gamma-HCH transport system ATP-binding protein